MLGGLFALTAVSGCWLTEEREPDQEMTEIHTQPAEGADLICGMDRGSVELAMGLAVGRVDDDLSVEGGVGTGECAIWPEDESLVDGPLLSVTLVPVASIEGREARGELEGADDFRRPDVVYDSVDGGAWGAVEPIPGRMTSGLVSYVFQDETLIRFVTVRGGVERDPVADVLALTRQVAGSYGLDAEAADS